jgi:hypothetical protein
MRRFQRHLFHRVDEVECKINQALHLHTRSSPPIPLTTTSRPPLQYKPGPSQAPSAKSLSLSTTETLPREKIPAANLAIARLGDEDFAYDKSKLQGPPLIHLSKDIQQLCQEWESSKLLVVNGRGIPVKFWGEFFKKSKTRMEFSAWDSIKVEWGNWKVSYSNTQGSTMC